MGAAMLKNVPPAMAAAYKKRFPHFWRMKDGLRVHTGPGYDHEEDPDFEEKKRDETIELSSGSESDDESSSSDEEEEEEDMVKGEEVAELSSMVEDMMIPDDSILEGAVDEAIKEVDNGEESDESEEYEDDIEYKPIEEDVAIDESDDSYTPANEDSEESS